MAVPVATTATPAAVYTTVLFSEIQVVVRSHQRDILHECMEPALELEKLG